MRLLVCGGRDYADQTTLTRVLDRWAKGASIDCVIEGNARGADRMAGFWARQRGIPNIKFNVDWERYGKAAGSIRNQQMLDEGRPDLVLAFPGGWGTEDMIRRAEAAGVDVCRVPPSPHPVGETMTVELEKAARKTFACEDAAGCGFPNCACDAEINIGSRLLLALREPSEAQVEAMARAIEESVCSGIEASDRRAIQYRYEHAKRLARAAWIASIDHITGQK